MIGCWGGAGSDWPAGAACRLCVGRRGADARGVRLSSIFDWYGDDWAVKDSEREGELSAKSTGVLRFVRKYAPRRARSHLGPPAPTLSYIEYSWALNDQN